MTSSPAQRDLYRVNWGYIAHGVCIRQIGEALGGKNMELCIEYHNLCKHKFKIGKAVLLIHNIT